MKNVAIYGASTYGKLYCQVLEQKGFNVCFFVDEYSKEKTFLNKDIFKAKDVKEKDIPVFISVTTKTENVELFLKEHKFSNIITLLETFEKVPEILKGLLSISNMWFDTPDKMIDIEKLDSVSSLLKDGFSKNLLKEIIHFRQDINSSNYIVPQSIDDQYFPKDIDIFKSEDMIRFIDCGAFNGDTINLAMKNFSIMNKGVEYITSIEPDTINIENISKEQEKQKKIFLNTNFLTYCAAVWSENKILKFDGSGTAGSISSEGIQIPGISLDSCFKNASPNYIKMDIEGAEKDAILGTEKLIKEKNPILAICVYHKPEDLWEIPLLINDINPNYDMYLRVYGHLGLETVLYCVPKNLEEK